MIGSPERSWKSGFLCPRYGNRALEVALDSIGQMLPADVISLYRALVAADSPVWLMGGWGVDALLGRQTRPHHDLDLLVDRANLERLRLCLMELGFTLKYTWDDEVRWIRDDTWSSPLEQPSAFVCGHNDGREVDVHVVRQSDDGSVELLWNVPYAFTAQALGATGVVDGEKVRCLSREIQRQAHTGYALPAHHLQDLHLLDEE
jgi:lincosamide nucleotidyltransferase A/C/D/E